MKKANLAKKNFIIVSAVFIIGLIFAYGTRLVHFYLIEQKKPSTDDKTVSTNYFNDILENTINVENTSGGLYLDGDNYLYKYAATENYLWYSGQMWRILKINDDKTITIITDNSITLLQSKYEETAYIEDYLKEFYSHLDQEYLVKFNSCNDTIDDVKNINCENPTETNISLLDMYTYNKIGSLKSFINNGESFWLINKNGENNYWYIDNTGAVGVGSEIPHGIKAVVTLKNEITLAAGKGTKENPYIIIEKKNTKLSEVFTGEYIKYNDSLWRILSINENSVQALKATCIENEEGECLDYRFGNNITYLNSALYKYLNNTYFNKLENNDFLVKDNFYVGNYTNYDFKELKSNSVSAYIGLPKIADYYIKNNTNSYLITPNIIETIYTINEIGNYYLVKPTTERNIYPIINFDINLNIEKGNGTIENPYELSR